jgi:hypothetical protein
MGSPIRGWMAAVMTAGRMQANSSQHKGALGRVRDVSVLHGQTILPTYPIELALVVDWEVAVVEVAPLELC